MNSKEAGIYSITSKINGKRYIGSAIRICTRWAQHKIDLRANKHHSQHLQNHYNKYGENDLIFSVVEIIEKQELDFQSFKQLLLDREQTYLNNWEECQFNCRKSVFSSLGCKQKDSKYYIYHKEHDLYCTYYSIDGDSKYFSSHILEKDAKIEVEYIKTLNEKQLIEYFNICKNKIRAKKRNTKNYIHNKKYNNWTVQLNIKGEIKYFGCFHTEQEAINQVKYLDNLNEEQKLEYCKEYVKIPKSHRKRDSKYYTFNKTRNRWVVQARINGIMKGFGYFKTEQEAIDKVNQVKLEFGIK